MSPEQIIKAYDGGSTTIYYQGRPYNLGVVHLKITKGEAAPEIITGHCRLNHKEGCLKYLSRIDWAPLNVVEEMVKAEHRPEDNEPALP